MDCFSGVDSREELLRSSSKIPSETVSCLTFCDAEDGGDSPAKCNFGGLLVGVRSTVRYVFRTFVFER